MATKVVSSTETQNNFGQIIDDAVENGTRYVVKRRKVAQVIIMSLAEFARLLSDRTERSKVVTLVRDLAPIYNLGEDLNDD